MLLPMAPHAQANSSVIWRVSGGCWDLDGIEMSCEAMEKNQKRGSTPRDGPVLIRTAASERFRRQVLPVERDHGAVSAVRVLDFFDVKAEMDGTDSAVAASWWNRSVRSWYPVSRNFKNPATRSFMAWPSSIFRLDSWATADIISKTMFLRTL